MNINIPELGTKLKLSEDWEFDLYEESRNDALWLVLTGKRPEWCLRTPNKKSFVLPKGTVITVDRIYIRKGSSEFSSVSFNLDRKTLNADHSKIIAKLAKAKGRCRFWVKLVDTNKITYEN